MIDANGVNWAVPSDENLFLISSAINTPRGMFNATQRLDQTFETIESIKKYVVNPRMILVDSSIEPLTDEITAKLQNRGIFTIISYPKESSIIRLSESGMNSPAEALSMAHAIASLKNPAYPTLMKVREHAGRIYKISGRYVLNSHYTQIDNKTNYGKYVFKQVPTWRPDKNPKALFITRLWSMCPSLIDHFLNATNDIFKSCMDGGLDLEHSMFKHLNSGYVNLTNVLGVEGRVAPNGEFVKD